MKRLILVLFVVVMMFSPVGRSIQSVISLTWNGFINSLDNKPKQAVKARSNNSNSYSQGITQTNSNNQVIKKSSRGVFSQLRQSASSEIRKNNAGSQLSQQRATNTRDLNYGNTASLTQVRNENNSAFRQASGGNVSQSLSQSRLAMSTEFASY